MSGFNGMNIFYDPPLSKERLQCCGESWIKKIQSFANKLCSPRMNGIYDFVGEKPAQRDLLALIRSKTVSMFGSHAEIKVWFYGVAFITTNHFEMTNSVTADPLTLTAVSHHTASFRCTGGHYSARHDRIWSKYETLLVAKMHKATLTDILAISSSTVYFLRCLKCMIFHKSVM